MSERRYNDDEVKEIFERAAKGDAREQHAIVPRDEGMSLAELQEIGREAGLEPASIAEAAMTLEKGGAVPSRGSMMGMPVSVGRVVELPRAPTDREWETLVAELRQTFGARGRVESLVATRSWTNGNLHAYIEPSGNGYRLRLGTLKGNALALNAWGALGIVSGAIMFGSMLIGGGFSGGIEVPILLTATGIGALVANRLRLPRWARQREEQMDYIAERARRLLAGATQPTT